MAEVKCGDCILRIAGKCRILGSAVAVDADCSLSPAQRKDLLYQTRRIIGTAGGNRAVEVESITACDGGAHLHITFSVDGGASRTRTFSRRALIEALQDQTAEEQFLAGLAATLIMANPSSGAEAVAVIEGGVFHIG